MIIKKVDIPEDETTGLGEIKMSRTEKLVLIAGKNGSGKSRILSKVRSTLSKKPTRSKCVEADNFKKICNDQIADYREQIHILNTNENNNPTKDWLVNNLNTLNQKIKESELRISHHDLVLNWNLIETSESSDSYECVDFVPKTLNMKDSRELSDLSPRLVPISQ